MVSGYPLYNVCKEGDGGLTKWSRGGLFPVWMSSLVNSYFRTSCALNTNWSDICIALDQSCWTLPYQSTPSHSILN